MPTLKVLGCFQDSTFQRLAPQILALPSYVVCLLCSRELGMQHLFQGSEQISPLLSPERHKKSLQWPFCMRQIVFLIPGGMSPVDPVDRELASPVHSPVIRVHRILTKPRPDFSEF